MKNSQAFNDFVRPLVATCGKGVLRKRYRIIDWYCHIQSRFEYLAKIEARQRKNEGRIKNIIGTDNNVIGTGINHRDTFLSEHMMLQDHLRLLREMKAEFDRLDINNTIYHLEKTITSDKHWRELYRRYQIFHQAYPSYVYDAYFEVPRPIGTYHDKAVQMLLKGQEMNRRSMYLQRLKNEMEIRHAQGWFFVFDTITLAPDKLNYFAETPRALTDYCRKIGRKVNLACGFKYKDSFDENYKYFMVPEYGDKNGRLHFHVLHMCRRLPKNTVDPNNYGQSKSRYYREVNTFKGIWEGGTTMPLAVRYHGDAYTRSGWAIPLDKKTEKPIEMKPLEAVIHYVSKYVSKNTDARIRDKLKRNKEKWKRTIAMTKLKDMTHRVRMSRKLGLQLPSMEKLSIQSLEQLTKLHWSVSPKAMLLKQSAKQQLASRLEDASLNQLIQVLPHQTSMLDTLRTLMKRTSTPNQLNFIDFIPPSLTSSDISDEVRQWLKDNDLWTRKKTVYRSSGAPR